jgi:hypothetical protein
MEIFKRQDVLRGIVAYPDQGVLEKSALRGILIAGNFCQKDWVVG